MSKEKFSLQDEVNALAQIVSGEDALRKREEELSKMKEEAIKKERQERKRKIVEGEAVLKKEEDIEDRKVVQNIKIFEWEAPEIARIKFEKKSYLILVCICLFLILYFAILENYGLMACLIALLFLIYVWGTAEPRSIKYKITARGIDVGNKLYEWYMLDSFYFTKKGDQLFLFVDTKLRFPPSLMFMLNEEDKDALFVVLQDKLLYKDIRKQDKLSRISYGEYIPLEKV